MHQQKAPSQRQQQLHHRHPHPHAGGPIRSVEGWVVFVTGLHEEATENDVEDLFGEHGRVKFVRVSADRNTSLNKGYALVEYERQSEAKDAINHLHGSEFMGKPIGVDWAFVSPGGGRRRKQAASG